MVMSISRIVWFARMLALLGGHAAAVLTVLVLITVAGTFWLYQVLNHPEVQTPLYLLGAYHPHPDKVRWPVDRVIAAPIRTPPFIERPNPVEEGPTIEAELRFERSDEHTSELQSPI